MRKHKNFIRIILAFFQSVLDVLIYFLSFSLAVSIWHGGEIYQSLNFEAQIFFAGTILAVFCFNSLYKFKTWLLWDEMKAVIESSFLVLLVTVLYLYSQRSELSRFVTLASMMIFVPLCVTGRYIFRRLMFALGVLSTDIIILGAGRTGKIFAEKIIDHPFTLGKISGFLDDDESKIGTTVAGFKVRGKLDDFETLCEHENIDEAAVAISKASRKFIAHILDLVEFSVRQVHYIPDMYMLTTFSSEVRDVDGIPVISASYGLANPINRAVKSFADYSVGTIALVILSPLMLWAVCKVKMKHGGSILSSQERAGLHGNKFMMYEFTSSSDAGTDTRLRRSYIDELPQLFNVMRGEMSLVGPKAIPASDVYHVYGEEAAGKIAGVKPGITGFWQISRDKDADRKIRAEMDLYYIRNWSLWLDAVIIMKTSLELTLFRFFKQQK